MEKIEKYFKWIVLGVAILAIAMYFVNNRYFITSQECGRAGSTYNPAGTFVLDRWTGDVDCRR